MSRARVKAELLATASVEQESYYGTFQQYYCLSP